MSGREKEARENELLERERDETSCRMAVRAETAQLTDGLERSLLILEGATKEEGRKWFCCFAVFCFTLVIGLAVYLDHTFPHASIRLRSDGSKRLRRGRHVALWCQLQPLPLDQEGHSSSWM